MKVLIVGMSCWYLTHPIRYLDSWYSANIFIRFFKSHSHKQCLNLAAQYEELFKRRGTKENLRWLGLQIIFGTLYLILGKEEQKSFPSVEWKQIKVVSVPPFQSQGLIIRRRDRRPHFLSSDRSSRLCHFPSDDRRLGLVRWSIAQLPVSQRFSHLRPNFFWIGQILYRSAILRSCKNPKIVASRSVQ